MTNNLGTDIMLDDDGDLLLAPNGDLMDTDAYQTFDSDTTYPFDGYVNLRESVYRVLTYEASELSIFDIYDGAGLNSLLSQNIDEQFPNFIERANQQLLKDDRIKEVNEIYYEINDINIVNVYIVLTTVGSNVPTSFVFPYAA